jgi:hypothetical protein
MTQPGKLRRLHYHPPAPVIICDSRQPGHKLAYIGGKWIKAYQTAAGWRIGSRTGTDLRQLAREVGNV